MIICKLWRVIYVIDIDDSEFEMVLDVIIPMILKETFEEIDVKEVSKKLKIKEKFLNKKQIEEIINQIRTNFYCPQIFELNGFILFAS